MAELPAERVAVNQPAFSCVGVDVFGPFLVKYGRSEVKRYTCLFTCLSTRAVHLEKIDSLDTSSFINAFCRFTARRGHPQTVYSDNATNFKAGELIINHDETHAFAIKHKIDWKFNPHTASHMDGAWERLIRTIRRVMLAVLDNTRLTDEILETVFCEIENIVNSRPLTKLSDDGNIDALTPNQLLILKKGHPILLANLVKVTSTELDGDMYNIFHLSSGESG